MKKYLLYGVLALVLPLGLAAGVAAGNPHGEPPGQGDCSHGATGKDCKPDPQPGHGKDCEEHGPKNGGVNEDHCTQTDTTPTETTPTETTPTTPTETTPTETTPTTTTEHPRCPPGMGPYAGKDGEPGNDECCPDANGDHVCDVPPAPEQPLTRTDPTPSVVPPVTTSTTAPQPLAKPKPKPVARKPLAHKPDKPVKLTGNPKTDKCKDLGNGTMRCKGVVVTQGNG